MRRTKIKYTPEEVRKQMRTTYQEDGAAVTAYEDCNGSICSTVYKPFSGAAFVYKDVRMPQFVTNWRYGPTDAFSIEYCLEGRLECQIDGRKLSLSQGDLLLLRTDPNQRILYYPDRYYQAASIRVQLDEPSSVLNMHLGMTGITLDRLIDHYIPEGEFFCMLQEKVRMKNLFETMVHGPETIKNSYYGVKILESLILLASDLTLVDEGSAKKSSKHQEELVQRVYQYAMTHTEKRFSITELAEKFSVSATYLKNSFQAVYGMPMQRLIREQKMRAAAKVLETTDKNVTEVAQMFGYSNISKFADAFKGVLGEYPKEYRRKVYELSDQKQRENV